jgi:hypothetical protein
VNNISKIRKHGAGRQSQVNLPLKNDEEEGENNRRAKAIVCVIVISVCVW